MNHTILKQLPITLKLEAVALIQSWSFWTSNYKILKYLLRTWILKFFIFCNRPKIKLCLGPIQIFLGYIDLLKDSILLSKLVTALGGFYIISINPTKFSSVVSFYEYILMKYYIQFKLFFFLGCIPIDSLNNCPYNSGRDTFDNICSWQYIWRKTNL